MSEKIQLLPGLIIHFNDDGTWLYFEGDTDIGAVCLENTLTRDRVVGTAVSQWIERMLNSPIGAAKEQP